MSNPSFEKIVVPTDFSELATGALLLAGEIARRSNGELDVIYADPFLPPSHFTAGQVEAIVEELEKSKSRASDELERYVADHVDGEIRSRAVVVEGLPVPAITGWSEEHEADLIVMGTHGRSGVNRMMLGSVTERVLRETAVPLLTTRSSSDAPEPIRRILCPVNFTGAATRALTYARALADLFGAKLIVVHVAEEERDRKREIEEIDRCLVRAGESGSSEIERLFLRGEADQEVLRYAAANSIDLIVLAAQHKTFFDTTVLGSTTVHVIRHSPVPVLTITHRPE